MKASCSQEKLGVFFNWSANESTPSFVARPVIWEKFVEVTMENEIGRIEGILNLDEGKRKESGLQGSELRNWRRYNTAV